MSARHRDRLAVVGVTPGKSEPIFQLSFVASSSGNGALANVTLDRALRDTVPSVFRQSPEDSERCPSPVIGSMRGQASSHEHRS